MPNRGYHRVFHRFPWELWRIASRIVGGCDGNAMRRADAAPSRRLPPEILRRATDFVGGCDRAAARLVNRRWDRATPRRSVVVRAKTWADWFGAIHRLCRESERLFGELREIDLCVPPVVPEDRWSAEEWSAVAGRIGPRAFPRLATIVIRPVGDDRVFVFCADHDPLRLVEDPMRIESLGVFDVHYRYAPRPIVIESVAHLEIETEGERLVVSGPREGLKTMIGSYPGAFDDWRAAVAVAVARGRVGCHTLTLRVPRGIEGSDAAEVLFLPSIRTLEVFISTGDTADRMAVGVPPRSAAPLRRLTINVDYDTSDECPSSPVLRFIVRLFACGWVDDATALILSFIPREGCPPPEYGRFGEFIRRCVILPGRGPLDLHLSRSYPNEVDAFVWDAANAATIVATIADLRTESPWPSPVVEMVCESEHPGYIDCLRRAVAADLGGSQRAAFDDPSVFRIT